MDNHTPEQRTRNMKAVHNKNSKIEVLLRKELWKRGLRYQKNTNKVYGHPDIAFIGKKIAVLCDSEFWHGYQCQICGAIEGLQLHHVVGLRNGGNHSAENLITLCDSCSRHLKTGNVEYAIRSCARNACQHYRIDAESSLEDEKELLGNAVYILQNLFSEFSTYYSGEYEYLSRLDTAISYLERIKK